MNEIVSGSIQIGTHNLDEFSPMHVRALMAYIPQEPFLFKGTLRDNLDPFSEYPDEELIRVLQESKLMKSFTVVEGSSNDHCLNHTVLDN